MKNYYKILGVKPQATAEEIKEAFRNLAQKCHPDRNPGDEKAKQLFQEINEAYQVLSDAGGRARFDQELRRESEGTTPVPGMRQQQAEAAYRPPEAYQDPTRDAASESSRRLPRWLRDLLGFFQLGWWSLIGAAIGSSMSVGHRALVGLEPMVQVQSLVLGAVFGGLASITLAGENRLEQQLKARFKDGYHLVRSMGTCLSGAYFGAMAGDLLANWLGLDYAQMIQIMMALFAVLFGWIANQEAFWAKLRLPKAWFELLFTLVRGLGITLIVSGIALGIGYIMTSYEFDVEYWQLAFYGFMIGSVFGSMAPSDLLAYSRYASAYVGRLAVLLFILAALFLGFLFGVFLQTPIYDLFGI